MRVRSVLSVTVIASAALLSISSAQADTSVRHNPDGDLTNIVQYKCESAEDVEYISVQVEMTMPTNAQTGAQMTIGWRGTYVDGSQLAAPAGGLNNAKLYAYASISGLTGLTSATGVGQLSSANIPAGQPVPLPTGTVELKTTANNAGTATVKPAAINFGPSPSERVIECEVQNPDGLRTYTLTVGQGTGTTPSPSPTATNTTPGPTTTATATATVTTTATEPEPTTDDDGKGGVVKTPAGSAATGGGGEAGPDARLITLTGLVLMLTGVTGLIWRQRRVRRG